MQWARKDRAGAGLHNTWHEYLNKFFDSEKNEWKRSGFDLIEETEKWAADHQEVEIVWVDDAVHSNSVLILIPHATRYHYMGTTVLYIPQNGDGTDSPHPSQFFLYPRDHDGLIKSLERIKNKYKNRRGWKRPF